MNVTGLIIAAFVFTLGCDETSNFVGQSHGSKAKDSQDSAAPPTNPTLDANGDPVDLDPNNPNDTTPNPAVSNDACTPTTNAPDYASLSSPINCADIDSFSGFAQAQTRLHFVAVYEASNNASDCRKPGTISVTVNSGAPLALVLSAYEPTVWNLQGGTSSVAMVFLNGYLNQEVTGAGGAQVIKCTYYAKFPVNGDYANYSGGEGQYLGPLGSGSGADGGWLDTPSQDPAWPNYRSFFEGKLQAATGSAQGDYRGSAYTVTD